MLLPTSDGRHVIIKWDEKWEDNPNHVQYIEAFASMDWFLHSWDHDFDFITMGTGYISQCEDCVFFSLKCTVNHNLEHK